MGIVEQPGLSPVGHIRRSIKRVVNRIGYQLERFPAPHSYQRHLQAASCSAYEEAATLFRQALAVIEHLPPTRETVEAAVDLRLCLRNALVPLGHTPEILRVLEDARDLAQSIGDEGRLGRVLVNIANEHTFNARTDAALETAGHALTIAERSGDSALAAWTRFSLGEIHYSRGNFREALTWYAGSEHPANGDGFVDPSVRFADPAAMSRTFRAIMHANLGEFDQALDCGREALRAAEARGRPYDVVYACYGIGATLVLKGDFHQASAILERGLQLRSSHHLREPRNIGLRLGHAYIKLGRVDEGLRLVETVQAVADSQARGKVYYLASLADAYLQCGRIGAAEALSERAVAQVGLLGERSSDAYALMVAGRVQALCTPPDLVRAEKRYLEAIEVGTDLGMRPLLAHCHHGLGRLYRCAQQPEKAEEHLTTATRMFRDLGMRFWLEQMEAEAPSFRA